MNIQDLYSIYAENYLVDTDTRSIRKGSVFFALKGVNFNGNQFASLALEKGASIAIVEEEEYANNEKIILVTNVLETLQKLARLHRDTLGIPIIGLTGSNGKTTTKELMKVVLEKKYRVMATKGNLNNHIGVPLTLLAMKPTTELGVVEMGANHHHEIALLSSIANPDIGYITNFGKAHLEGFGSVEGVIEAKSELYDFLRDNGKKAMVNRKDPIQVSKTKHIDTISFVEDIELVDANPFITVRYNNVTIESKLIGTYNYTNIAAALTIGQYLEVSEDLMIEAIKNYIPSNNRSQIIDKGNMRIVLDAYNANPTSMEHAISSFISSNDGAKVLILGDMLELGKDSLTEHQIIVDRLEKIENINVFLVGEYFSQTKTSFLRFTIFEELEKAILASKMENCSLLIKGSRGMALERILDIM